MDSKIQNSLIHIQPSLTRTHKHLILSLSCEEGANMKNEFIYFPNIQKHISPISKKYLTSNQYFI